MVTRKDKNPWAICTASVGRENKDKYERCVQSIKMQEALIQEIKRMATSKDSCNNISERTRNDSKRSRRHTDRVLGRSKRSSARLKDLMDKGVDFADANSPEGTNVSEGLRDTLKKVRGYLEKKWHQHVVADPKTSKKLSDADEELPRGREFNETPQQRRRREFWEKYRGGKK